MAQEANAKIKALCPSSSKVVSEKASAKNVERVIIQVEFDTNKADIKPQYNDEIKRFADMLKQNSDEKLL